MAIDIPVSRERVPAAEVPFGMRPAYVVLVAGRLRIASSPADGTPVGVLPVGAARVRFETPPTTDSIPLRRYGVSRIRL